MNRSLAFALVALVLAACTTDAAQTDQSESAVQVVTETETVTEDAAEPDAGAGGDEESERPSPDASADPAPPAIASALGEIEGLRVEVLALERSGETLTLDFAIVNESSQDITLEFTDLGAADSRPVDFFTVGGVTLTDDVNQQRYLVLRQPDGLCVCSVDVQTTHPAGRRSLYYAKFPAPPDDVDVVSVLVPNFSPLDGVAVSG